MTTSTAARCLGFRCSFRRLGLAALAVAGYALAAPAHALVNAEPVTDERFAAAYPWAVVVVNKISGGICGGVLIAPRWVLTAAHCTSGGRHVLVGSASRQAARQVEIDKAIRHPEYSLDALQNDVGLLLLSETVDGPLAPLATSIEARLLLRPRVAARILGWGKTATSAAPVDRLREAAVYLEELRRTGSRFSFRYTSGPCARDSGSPLLRQTLDGRWLVVGLASATEGNLCSTGGGRAYYSHLGRAQDFIFTHTQQP